MNPADAEQSDELAAGPRLRSDTGCDLQLTLWMIAIMGLVAATLNIWVANTVANSQALAQRTELELAQSNIRNELVYMLGTRPSSYRGIEVGTDVKFADANDFNAILAGP